MDGADPVSLRHKNLNSTGVTLKAEEEQSKDAEMNHNAQSVGWLVIGE